MTCNRPFSSAGSFCSERTARLSFSSNCFWGILALVLSTLNLSCVPADAQQQPFTSLGSERLPGVSGISPANEAGASTPLAALPATLPDAPNATAIDGAQQSSSSTRLTPGQIATHSDTNTDEGRQTKRILGIVPNFRSVSASSHPPPESAHEKLVGFFQDSFDYSALIFVGEVTVLNQLSNSTPEFHQGAKGFARYYWHSFVDQTDENLWVSYMLPAALHQDPRYFTLGHGGALKRIVYSFSRIVVTRTDSGGSAFNYSEVVGSGAAAGISNLYYPSKERTLGNTGRQWGTNVALDGGTFIFKEFWPDLNHAVFHQKN